MFVSSHSTVILFRYLLTPVILSKCVSYLKPKTAIQTFSEYNLYVLWFKKHIAFHGFSWHLCRGLFRWRVMMKVLFIIACHLVPHCVPENIIRFSSVEPPGISTLYFLALHPLSPPAMDAEVSVKRAVCLSLFNAALGECLGRNLTWYIKCNRKVMCPLRRHHWLTQENTNPSAYNKGEPRVTIPFLYFIFGIYTIKILRQCTTHYLQKNARRQKNTCKRQKFICTDQFQ